MKSTGKWNVPRLASQMVQARNKRMNCPNIETNTLYQRRKIERGIQTRQRSKLRCTSDGHCFDLLLIVASSWYLRAEAQVWTAARAGGPKNYQLPRRPGTRTPRRKINQVIAFRAQPERGRWPCQIRRCQAELESETPGQGLS